MFVIFNKCLRLYKLCISFVSFVDCSALCVILVESCDFNEIVYCLEDKINLFIVIKNVLF